MGEEKIYYSVKNITLPLNKFEYFVLFCEYSHLHILSGIKLCIHIYYTIYIYHRIYVFYQVLTKDLISMVLASVGCGGVFSRDLSTVILSPSLGTEPQLSTPL